VVTDNTRFAWRSDLSDIGVSEDGKIFVETTKDGCRTTFIITLIEPFARYEFDVGDRGRRDTGTARLRAGKGCKMIMKKTAPSMRDTKDRAVFRVISRHSKTKEILLL
jgi:hypothetical protein